jgi:hypothetical protein
MPGDQLGEAALDPLSEWLVRHGASPPCESATALQPSTRALKSLAWCDGAHDATVAACFHAERRSWRFCKPNSTCRSRASTTYSVPGPGRALCCAAQERPVTPTLSALWEKPIATRTDTYATTTRKGSRSTLEQVNPERRRKRTSSRTTTGPSRTSRRVQRRLLNHELALDTDRWWRHH